MAYLVRAFPLIRPVSELHTFLAALSGARREDTDRFYRYYDVSHESAYVQETPDGNLLIVVTVVRDHLKVAPRYKAASEDFHAWFKSQILYLTGVDPNVTPLGPPTTEVFSWESAAN